MRGIRLNVRAGTEQGRGQELCQSPVCLDILGSAALKTRTVSVDVKQH